MRPIDACWVHADPILKHYAHAREKHPYFCDRLLPDWSKEKILHEWVEAGRPCTLIHGFAYKGAKPHLIGNEEALKRIKTHSFGVGYYSMEWTVFEGMAVLQFAEYSEGDME